MPDIVKAGQTLGAIYLGGHRTHFRVWAPQAEQMQVKLLKPEARLLALKRGMGGYWEVVAEDVEPGCLYVYRINGEKERPDPASRCQPDGVHGPSMVTSSEFAWEDTGWHGIPLEEYVIYELHIGTFSPEGTFEGAIQYLAGLKELGITAIEIMPVAQFPGPRNWGYDGVGLFAPQNSYGGPDGLRKLVNACHQEGLAVVLDVVYNHLGAEGNYLWDYGPYFTDRYKTPWGSAVNFDGARSDDVRRYFSENAIYWLTDFHVDALRLDAVHAILDFSGVTFLEELVTAIERQRECLNRRLYLIAESDLNNHRMVLPQAAAGYGLDAQWSDDFHHAVHTLLTHEADGYYQDFMRLNGKPTLSYLAKTLREGYAYSGQYSRFRKRRHGTTARDVPAHQLVVCIQNHDQIGNRMMGDRLATLVPFERVKLGAGLLLLAPFVPMLFMGEEYGETNPFQYFVSHGDPDLVQAVRKGRREEFADFAWEGEPPDPAAEETFTRSKLCRQDAESAGHQILHDLHQELIRLRKTLPALRLLSKKHLEVQEFEQEQVLYMRRWADGAGDGASGSVPGDHVWIAFNFGTEPAQVRLTVPAGRWRKQLDSAEARWQSASEYLSEALTAGAAQNRGALAPVSALFRRRAEAPGQIQARSEISLTLAPSSFALYVRDSEV